MDHSKRQLLPKHAHDMGGMKHKTVQHMGKEKKEKGVDPEWKWITTLLEFNNWTKGANTSISSKL